MIPKVIHYCWFGHNQKPVLVQKCIDSWKKYCPDYEIIEWNETNFDVSSNIYAKEAYEVGMWAFVADYARLWIVYNRGGIYLDTDVELIKPLDDLLESAGFFGLEDNYSINTGLGFGASINNKIVKCMLMDYENIHFVNMDGAYDRLPCPIRNTRAILSYLGRKIDSEKINYFTDGNIYPAEYFCPLSADGKYMRKTKNTYSIHWYSATWLSKDEMVVHQWRLFKNRCERFFGKVVGGYIARCIYLFLPKKRAILKRM